MSLRDNLTADQREHEWIAIIERMTQEQIAHGWNHHMFVLFRSVFLANGRLEGNAGFIFEWAMLNYLDSSLMLLRRELDYQANTENLRHLVADIVRHPELLTRRRYLARWNPADEQERQQANRVFDSFNPTHGVTRDEDRLNEANAQREFDDLVAAIEPLREYAERTRAHRTPAMAQTTTLTFRDLHGALNKLKEVSGKYYTFLTLHSLYSHVPQAQYDIIAPFMEPWVTDRAAVVKLMREEG